MDADDGPYHLTALQDLIQEMKMNLNPKNKGSHVVQGSVCLIMCIIEKSSSKLYPGASPRSETSQEDKTIALCSHSKPQIA